MVDYTVNLYDSVYGEHELGITTGVWVGLTDTATASDYTCRMPDKKLTESMAVTDSISKDVGKLFEDASIVGDVVARDVVRIFRFEAPSVGFVSRAISKSLIETVSILEWIIVPVILRDSVIASDRIARDTATVLGDSVVVGYLIASLIERNLFDTIKPSDYTCRDILKIYTDAGILQDTILRGVDKALTDTTVGLDVAVKDVLRNFLFESPVTGFSSLGVSKELVEEVDVSDWLTKTLSKFVDILESCVVSDRIARDTMRVFTDSSVGEFLVSKGFGTIKTEVINVSDYVCRDVSKPFFETLTVTDILYKNIGKMIVDQVFDTGELVRLTAKSVIDRGAMKDVLTKVAYKLTGLNVRRVYWLGGVYWVLRDIIEPEDHNVRIEVAKILLERMKHLKGELE